MLRASPPLRAGQKLGRYELIAPVARGSWDSVGRALARRAYLAFHKLVAIKTLLPPAAGDSARMEQKLLDEARIAALIQHSNVAQTLELGEHEGTLYLVMEWVPGEPLSDVTPVRATSWRYPALGRGQLGRASAARAASGTRARDDSGRPLGHRTIATYRPTMSWSATAGSRNWSTSASLRRPNQRTSFGDSEIEGKFSYMAPEQVLGAAVDRRTDLFAVGVMLYTLTTGRHPFAGADSSGCPETS